MKYLYLLLINILSVKRSSCHLLSPVQNLKDKKYVITERCMKQCLEKEEGEKKNSEFHNQDYYLLFPLHHTQKKSQRKPHLESKNFRVMTIKWFDVNCLLNKDKQGLILLFALYMFHTTE